MTESEYLQCTDTRQLYLFLCGCGLSERKWWLIFFNHDLIDLSFAGEPVDSEEAREREQIRVKCLTGFRFVDGEVDYKEVLKARFPDRDHSPTGRLDSAINHVRKEFDVDQSVWRPGAAKAMSHMARDIAGNPFHPLTLPKPKHAPRRTSAGDPAHGCEICDGEDVCTCPGRRRARCLTCGGKWPECQETASCPWLTTDVLTLATAAYDLRDDQGRLENDRLCVLADALEEAGCGDVEVPCPSCSFHADNPVNPWRAAGYRPERDPASGRHEGGWTNCKTCNSGGKGGVRPGFVPVAHPLLAALRGHGVHYRGFHALDVVLGKS
jgi:hypothetical protein